MIPEICLMDLLKEEKDAVFNYNCVLSSIDNNMKFCHKRLQEEPEKRDSIERYYRESISRDLKRKTEAEKEVKNAREKIKEYFSKL